MSDQDNTQSVRHSWNRLMSWRAECHRRFGPVLEFSMITPAEALAGILFQGCRLLDVGAGAHKPFRSLAVNAGAVYFTLDTDPAGDFDFGSFQEMTADAEFDVMIANQVLEHMPVDEAFHTVCSSFERLVPGGRFVATVPNAAHPVRQRDCTHLTAWPANDLYSLLRSAGFEVDSMGRYNKFPLTSDPLRHWVVEVVCQEFRVDWCDSVLAVARKNE